MNKTKIEWTDYTWNPVTGCLNNCPYCYARKIAERFRGSKAFPNGFEPTIHDDRFIEPLTRTLHSKIFVCSMGELFGDWVPNEWIEAILATCRLGKHHIFQFLTKFPKNLGKWSPFPDNAWVGATTVDSIAVRNAVPYLWRIYAPIRFISLEPLMGALSEKALRQLKYLDWVIIGAQTNPYKPPKPEWVKEIIKAADKAGVPVFLKDNLCWPEKRQEFP